MFHYSLSSLADSLRLLELLRQRAVEQWDVKNEKYAIFYQTISFCLQSKCANQNNDDINNYIEKLKLEVSYHNGIEKPIHNYSNFDDINKYLEREITSACRHDFPKEWTVIQICKSFNAEALSGKFDDIVHHNTGIFMTIFKHAALKDMLMLEINKQSFGNENIFEKTYKLNRKILESLNFSKMPQETETQKVESKDKYYRAAKDIEKYVQEMVNLLKLLVGPWVCALSGNFKSHKSVDTENEIRRNVLDFLKKRTFDEHQMKLIQLVARRVDMLSHQQIFVAITYILRDKSNLGYNDIDLNDLYDYLTWLKQEYVYDDVSTYPCILIVDELIDQLPFEMVNTQQEFTRMCSFVNLKRMFERYRDSMKNGYVMCPTKNCQAIINPDGSLVTMEERMKNFFNYWLPAWKISAKQKPSKDEFCEILSQTDALVYCGHGSGLQLLSCEDVYNLKTKAIVFLFGCGSASLTSTGLNSELTGSHVYYHIGWSPVVIGFLWTVTDFNTDLCSTKLLSAWCNSAQPKAHWQSIDKRTWKNGNLGESQALSCNWIGH